MVTDAGGAPLNLGAGRFIEGAHRHPPPTPHASARRAHALAHPRARDPPTPLARPQGSTAGSWLRRLSSTRSSSRRSRRPSPAAACDYRRRRRRPAGGHRAAARRRTRGHLSACTQQQAPPATTCRCHPAAAGSAEGRSTTVDTCHRARRVVVTMSSATAAGCPASSEPRESRAKKGGSEGCHDRLVWDHRRPAASLPVAACPSSRPVPLSSGDNDPSCCSSVRARTSST